MRKVYWWREGCTGHEHVGGNNFGDELVPLMLQLLEVRQFEWSPPEDSDFVITGSVLEHLPRGWAGTVCGAGMLHEGSKINVGKATVLGVRGKLTLERLKGLKNPEDVVLGDPALLVPAWIRQYQGKWDLGIIPHWSDKELFQRYPYGHLIDVRKPPLDVVEDIAKCKRVISSSLHGIIVADAYGIPRQAELFPDALKRKQHEGGDFKWLDYASNFDGDPHFGELWKAPHDRVAAMQRDLRQMLATAMSMAPPLHTAPEPVREKSKFFCWMPKKKPQVSLLVPFRDDNEHRVRVWHWLKRYWEANLSSLEIIEGHDPHYPFSKTTAVNDAASRARGRIFAIIDADTYLDARCLQQYLDNIDAAVKSGKRMWYIPYNHLYRLSEEATRACLGCDPEETYMVPHPPPPSWLEDAGMAKHDAAAKSSGHQYGALAQVVPREAFFMVNGMDPRFRGWGGEDVSFMNAVDTVYCQHCLGTNDVVHMYHARPGMSWDTRRWVGQPDVVANSRLTQRYTMSKSEPGFMRALGSEYEPPRDVLKKHWWTRDA